ncbi:EF hand [Stieleria neptunia]|uniref:EF hand n=1 Tax=Stieleria neptunia TaxID=2527979 RepID=A0A518HWK4_9BACT|nr:EF-hand domain-containing protein [Stieleria neptunia]QDV45236.1 EF hand [Stieleria neptunia]
MSRTLSLVGLSIVIFAGTASAQILSGDKPDLYALIIEPIDLTDAARSMTVYDTDEDGSIDKDEQKRIGWKDKIDQFDLNRDGKLTHLELCVRFAKLRDESGVTQKVVNNAKVYLRRHDKNGNGQLDPDEIAGGWPSDPEEFDTNHDGVITLAEMAKRFAYMAGLRREMGIEQVDQVTAIRTVRTFDTDRDQKLDKDEQAGAFLPLPVKEFDEDDDGKLGIMEIATMLAKHRRESGMSKSDLAKVRSLFERYDRNSDGTIDETEYAAAATPFGGNAGANPLNELDKNKDGQLTQMEVQQVITQTRKSLGFNDDHLAEARKLLTRHDKDRSTYIEEAEFFESPVSGQLAKTTLKQADEDDDKRVSLIELAKHLAKQKE